MERRYRETTLKRKQLETRLIATGLVCLFVGRLLFGTPVGFFKSVVGVGTNFMRPAIFKYQENNSETLEVPFLVRWLAPQIFAYTWQEEVPAFAVIEVVRKEPESKEPVDEIIAQEQTAGITPIKLVVPQEQELSLMQENLYVHASEDDFTPAGLPNPFTGEIDTVLQTDNRLMLHNYDFTQYADTTQLIKDFYIVDASTKADPGLLNIDALMGYDCTIDKNAEGPQILVYHSHSQEGFADSIEGDVSTTIVGAGAKLARLLEEEYGFDVLHHTGVYDVPSRDDAYSKALPAVETVLRENPSIQVVIDLHRDAVAEGTKLVTNIDGKNYARFMFFNGICRSTNGPITYLNNPYLQENMAFSFQSQVVAESYFPGITRKIYLKAWRYNMHLKPRNMLIELGAQTNTVEEVMNTVEILAFTLNEVLSRQ